MVQPRLGFAWDVRGNGQDRGLRRLGQVLRPRRPQRHLRRAVPAAVQDLLLLLLGRRQPGARTAACRRSPGATSSCPPRPCGSSWRAARRRDRRSSWSTTTCKPPRSDQWTLGVRHQLGKLARLALLRRRARLQQPDVFLRRPAAGHPVRGPLRQQRADTGLRPRLLPPPRRGAPGTTPSCSASTGRSPPTAGGASTWPTPTPRPSRPAPTTLARASRSAPSTTSTRTASTGSRAPTTSVTGW